MTYLVRERHGPANISSDDTVELTGSAHVKDQAGGRGQRLVEQSGSVCCRDAEYLGRRIRMAQSGSPGD